MSDNAHQPSGSQFLGRLNMRFSGVSAAHEKEDTDFEARRRATQERLVAQYKDKSNIRSKYKGYRGPAHNWEEDGPVDPVMAKMTGQNLDGHTSGVPIFGREDAEVRTGWSFGHTQARNSLTDELREGLSAHLVKGVSAENSHAIGHADYGLDHELSAPAASKAQNTEQFAIELGMRRAAAELNGNAEGLGDERSLVHAKVTDVLHPKTGHLIARRFKLIRRQHAGDGQGTVVVDHMMDGQRTHISLEEAHDLGMRVHGALTADEPQEAEKSTASYSGFNQYSSRHGIGDILPPNRSELVDSQAGVLKALRDNRAALKKQSGFGRVPDREGVDYSNPAQTGVEFPRDVDLNRPGGNATGTQALSELHTRMAAHSGTAREDFLSSGSLPEGDASKLMRLTNQYSNRYGDVLAKHASIDPKNFTDHELASHIHQEAGVGQTTAIAYGTQLSARTSEITNLHARMERAGQNPNQYMGDDDHAFLRVGHRYGAHLASQFGRGKRRQRGQSGGSEDGAD